MCSTRGAGFTLDDITSGGLPRWRPILARKLAGNHVRADRLILPDHRVADRTSARRGRVYHRHDVDEFIVPVEVLLRPSSVSAIERLLAQGHAQAGHEV